MTAPPVRALVVGVNHYLDSPGFPALSGAVRDAVHMERLLCSRFGVAPERVECLLASSEIPRERQPTHRNMVRALDRLVSTATAGEQVFIHYSGHGARVPTAREDLKGPGAFDECLVPCDIGHGDSCYIRDLEVAALLDRLTAKGAFVTLVLDACHSGGATRGPAKARGLAERLTLSKPPDTHMASADEIRRAFERRRARAKGVRPEQGWVPVPKGYVCLAACRSAELAYEYPVAGNFQGALSYWIVASLTSSAECTYRQLFERVARRVRGRFEMQNPQLEGEADRTFLGHETGGERPSGVSILEVDHKHGRVQVAAGAVQGLGHGARLSLVPGDIEVQVVEADAVTSWAEAGDGLRLDGVSLDNRARVLEPGRAIGLRLGVAEGNSLSSELRVAIGATLQRRSQGSLCWAGADDPPNVLLAIEGGCFELRDPAGVTLSLQEPRLPAEVANVPRLAQRLRHLVRYWNVRDLENPDPVPYLRGALCVELGRLEHDYRAEERPRPRPETLGATHNAQVGQWLCLRIRNTSTPVLHVAVLDLQPDWGISQVLPTATDAPCLELEPGAENFVPLRADLPAGCLRGRDVLAVFASVAPTDFRCLELPPLAQISPHRVVRPVAVRNGLEAYLASLAGRSLTRVRSHPHAPRAPHAGRDWVTAQVTVDIRRL